VKVGVIGCGTISGAYLTAAKTFPILEVAACADVVPERAEAKAAEFAIPRACSVQELLADPAIDMVINLTIPRVHAEVDLAILEAGKHVYSEKPLALDTTESERLLALAETNGLRVGCAPDTFLGGGIQTCRKLIDDGWIGEPIAATAFMMSHGPESWHPDPAFYYHRGGGPLFDMGPYYLTTLVNLLGPVRRVTGSARASFSTRTITSQPKRGTVVEVEVPTHVAGVLDFASGAIGSIVMSFDVWGAELPRIEIYGSRGSLSVPDPNQFRGPVRVRLAGDDTWREVPLSHGYTSNMRGIGAADMAYAMRSGRLHRASGALAGHVLEVMQAIHESSQSGVHRVVHSTCERPAPLPLGLFEGDLDE
jgi:predicted dehydrogenase